IVILKYMEEWKLEEIAQILEMNVSTVKARLYRALKKLKIILEPEVT
ncbi:MAG: RNA polymerase sigma factor, partial [Lacrimispora sphenoides]